MSHNLEEDSTRIHIQLFNRDLARIDAYRGIRMNRSAAIRKLINKMLDAIESQAKLKSRPVELRADFDLGD